MCSRNAQKDPGFAFDPRLDPHVDLLEVAISTATNGSKVPAVSNLRTP